MWGKMAIVYETRCAQCGTAITVEAREPEEIRKLQERVNRDEYCSACTYGYWEE